jgi:rhodanese-related sulfurtransferase
MAIKTLTPVELRDRLASGDRLQLIDVRSSGEYAAGHVPGALNLPVEQAEARLDDVSPAHPVVLICQTGRRACLAHEALEAHRDRLLVLEGGTAAWAAQGLPTVSGQNSRWSLERQVRLAAGLLVVTGAGLGLSVSPGWTWLAFALGAGLTFAGLTNVCGMAAILAKMPWDRPARATDRPMEATR